MRWACSTSKTSRRNAPWIFQPWDWLPTRRWPYVEFWEEKFLGVHKEQVTLLLAPQTARILLIRRLPARPAVIATNMHLLGGYHEIERLTWDETTLTLSGSCRRMPGVAGRVYFYVPAGYQPHRDPAQTDASPLTHVDGPLWSAELVFDTAEAEFSTAFDRVEK